MGWVGAVWISKPKNKGDMQECDGWVGAAVLTKKYTSIQNQWKKKKIISCISKIKNNIYVITTE